jgi:hypothetical protein
LQLVEIRRDEMRVERSGAGREPSKMSLTTLRTRARRIPSEEIERIERELTAAGRERDAQVVRDEIARRERGSAR